MTQTALITGASAGIGKELAYLMAKDGHHLVLVARREKQLHNIAQELTKKHNISVKVIAKDLGKQEAPQEIYDEIEKEKIQVDILVNNAGFGIYGEFVSNNLQDEVDMIDLNIRSLTILTKLFAQGMVQRKHGRILNVASTAAFQPGPLMAVYYASKAYVLSFSEALANELKDTGVNVTVLCPGPTETEFTKRANLGESKLFDRGAMDVQSVARIGYDGMMRGNTLIIPGTQNRFFSVAVRFMPRKVVTSVVRRLQERRT